MDTLWLKFPDEVLFSSRFSVAEKRRLEDIFSVSDSTSAWRQALDRIGLSQPGHDRLIRWHRDAPYFNWSCMAQTVSGGAVHAVKKDGYYQMCVSYSPNDLWALLRSQWKIARFLKPKKEQNSDIAESIALGIALQALVLRLGSNVDKMASWLAAPDSAPKEYRKTLRQIQAVQMRRTEISHVWKEAFPGDHGPEGATESLSEFFWDDNVPVDEPVAAVERPVSDGQWKGLSVCGGQVTGLAVAVPSAPDPAALAALKDAYNAPLILVFRRARPETTELFGHAAALLFAEGGVLSHACTVARERNIPAITGLGPGFFELIKAGEKVWLNIDGRAATVARIPAAETGQA
jgi:pyruvate,water dikinase